MADLKEQELKNIPNNHVVAVIKGNEAAQALMADLQQSGLDNAMILRARDITEQIDPKAENAGLIGKVVKGVQDHLSEEHNYLAQYQESARAGSTIVAVPVSDKEQIDQVKEVLERHGAENMRHFGILAVTDLTPETNPSAPSEDSSESHNWSKV